MDVRWGFFFFENLTYFLFLRAVVNMPIQTLIIPPWLLLRKMIISQLELGPPVSGHTLFNVANKTTVISFRPHGYQQQQYLPRFPFQIRVELITSLLQPWNRLFFTDDIFSFWNWKEIIEIYEISCAVCNYACKLFWICKHFRRRIRLADRNNSLLIDFFWGDPWF